MYSEDPVDAALSHLLSSTQSPDPNTLALISLLQSNKQQRTDNATVRAFSAMDHMRRCRLDTPAQIITQFRQECMEELNVRGHQHWAYEGVWQKQNYAQCRSVGRCAYILTEIVELLDQGKAAEAHATSIQAWKALAQFSLDGQSWRAAWPLTGLPDPYSRKEFAGTPAELSTVAAYLKGLEALKTSIRQGSFGQGPDQVEAEKTAPSAKAPRRPKKPKGGGKGEGPKG